MQHCETLRIGPDGSVEFDPPDGKVITDALLKEYGSKEAAVEEMLYMTIIAAQRNDLTTLNALACAPRYWRRRAGAPPKGEQP